MPIIIGMALLAIALPNSLFDYVPSHGGNVKTLEDLSSFTFEIIGESGDYYIVRVVEVHNLPNVRIGDIWHVSKPQIPESVESGEI
jgi:hypothetical protein